MEYLDTITRAKNRSHITDVAKQLFQVHGITETTVKDIVKYAKIERKTFYNYFSDKEEIAHYIYYQIMEEFYSVGFTSDDYVDCENGFSKIRLYFNTLIDTMIELKEEMEFVSKYYYYFFPEINEDFLLDIYEDYEVQEPVLMFEEGIEDGSIKLLSGYPIEIFHMMDQSIKQYAYSIFIADDEVVQYDFIYHLVEHHLNAIKAK